MHTCVLSDLCNIQVQFQLKVHCVPAPPIKDASGGDLCHHLHAFGTEIKSRAKLLHFEYINVSVTQNKPLRCF